MLESLQEKNGLTWNIIEQHKVDASGEGKMWDLEAVAFNMPFTDTDTILGRMRATNVHENRRRDVQFVVGVYVHPVVHHIFSVNLRGSRHCSVCVL